VKKWLSKRREFLAVMAVLWTGIAVILVLVAQPWVAPIASKPPPVDAARLEAHVKKLSVDLYPRSFEQFAHLEGAARYIIAQLKASGATVSVQQVTVQDATYKNIIARFGPANGPLMVVGAHYDSYGNTSAASNSSRGYSPITHTPGADDNASGVAGLLELARLLGQQPQSRPIELVAYTLEEPPNFRSENMGSAWHAKSLKAAKRDVRLMLSLEMIGFFSDAPASQSYPVLGMSHIYSERGDFIALVGKFSGFSATRAAKALMAGATDLPVYSINAPKMMQGIDFSDHRSYWNQGYPAMMVTDTAFMRNPNYHHAGDTYDKLDYRRMAKVVQSVYAITQQY
jgi:Zn-dependent M28 family amino/carboxypeptidase